MDTPLSQSSPVIRPLMEKFLRIMPDFVDFRQPGEKFEKHELRYKRELLEAFEQKREGIESALDSGDAATAIQALKGIVNPSNLVNWRNWDPAFGNPLNTEATLELLGEFRKLRGITYEGIETISPLFAAMQKHESRMAWGLLTTLLWLWNPQEYYFIRSTAIRKFAAMLEQKMKQEAPSAEGLDAFMRLGHNVRDLLAPWNPQDWVDVQSFMWVVAQWDAPSAAKENATDGSEVQTDKNSRIWVIAPGEGARLWDECHQQGIIVIGWDELGSLATYADEEAIKEALAEARGQQNPSNDSLACWQFANEMQPGDWIVAKKGRKTVLGYGVVTSDYRFDPERSSYRNVRSVKWLKRGQWDLESVSLVIKTLTDYTPYQDTVRTILEEMGVVQMPLFIDGRTEPDTYCREDALRELFISEATFDRMERLIYRKKNLILQGPPGVGKSFLAKRLAYALMGQKDATRVTMIQFHQSYAYEDFIQGYRPNGGDGASFEKKDGVFYSFCKRAEENPEQDYYFIIDEINRGNLSRIFGELMLLIEHDKRGEDYAIPLTYTPEERFCVPENVYIIGMMNTADRSLAMVDYALRRRFAFVSLEPEFSSDKFAEHLRRYGVSAVVVERIRSRLSALNRLIADDARDLGAGFCIGHSFFCPTENVADSEAWYAEVVETEVRPLLEEYWADGSSDRAVEEIQKLLDA